MYHTEDKIAINLIAKITIEVKTQLWYLVVQMITHAAPAPLSSLALGIHFWSSVF